MANVETRLKLLEDRAAPNVSAAVLVVWAEHDETSEAAIARHCAAKGASHHDYGKVICVRWARAVSDRPVPDDRV